MLLAACFVSQFVVCQLGWAHDGQRSVSRQDVIILGRDSAAVARTRFLWSLVHKHHRFGLPSVDQVLAELRFFTKVTHD